MSRLLIISFFCFPVALISQAAAQDYSGSYSMQTPNGTLSITLQPDGSGGYHGRLEGNGNYFDLQGRAQGGMLAGSVGDEFDGISFSATLEGDRLTFIMSEMDEYGQADPTTAQTLVLQKLSGGTVTAASGTPPTPSTPQPASSDSQESSAVIINGKALSDAQLAELEKSYGIRPKAGKYWYDARSGLYGVVGYQAYGFMMPNHEFGPLDSKVSQGNTGVFVNGREIPLGEYTVWSYMVGSWIQPGRYWLDSNGNAGYEGNPYPAINLFAAAQQNAYRGQGGSGDNFWSTRFSAGNYNADNSQGYVSVPGYGPIGYGF